jgi:hypothetical protein
MKRLRTGVGEFRVALMCSEREPLDCHRAVLVCRHAKPFVDISHIHADGRLESHADAEIRMQALFDADQTDLFLSSRSGVSEMCMAVFSSGSNE